MAIITDRISMQRGIFQGCPISPYLFLFVIEIMALSIRQNENIKGISVKNQEAKISLLADDSVCFSRWIKGIRLITLFNTLHIFGLHSGCKINLSKSEAIWIGCKKGCQEFPYTQGITWKASQFKSLGITFCLNLGLDI